MMGLQYMALFHTLDALHTPRGDKVLEAAVIKAVIKAVAGYYGAKAI